MIEDWSLIEADFQREYGIDLVTDLKKMSWRKFLVLMKGLSKDSVFIVMNTDHTEQGTTVMEGESQEASLAVRSFFDSEDKKVSP